MFFQLQFLPYHHDWVTWWHRLAVVADLALLWIFWPSIARGKTTWIAWRDFQRGEVAAAAAASLVPLVLVFAIATFPGEWLDAKLPSIRFIPTKWPSTKAEQEWARTQKAEGEHEAPLASMGWTSLHELLVAGDVDLVARKPTSLWSNRIVVPGIDVIDRAKFDTEDKIKAARETFSLRGRRLEGAILIDARLRKVDFTAAQLQGAWLRRADLREASLKCEVREARAARERLPFLERVFEKREKVCANLQGADLWGTRLQGADLESAQLQGAELIFAHLEGTNLESAQLQGANLGVADLQGANLKSAQLQGAFLVAAHLEAQTLKARSCRARTSIARSCRAQTLKGRSCRAHR